MILFVVCAWFTWTMSIFSYWMITFANDFSLICSYLHTKCPKRDVKCLLLICVLVRCPVLICEMSVFWYWFVHFLVDNNGTYLFMCIVEKQQKFALLNSFIFLIQSSTYIKLLELFKSNWKFISDWYEVYSIISLWCKQFQKCSIMHCSSVM